MPLDANLADLVRHAEDFAARKGFTYTVLDVPGLSDDADADAWSEAEVVGCVYIYPVSPKDTENAGADVRVRSWSRASREDLDAPLWQAVSAWLAADWPFETVAYDPR